MKKLKIKPTGIFVLSGIIYSVIILSLLIVPENMRSVQFLSILSARVFNLPEKALQEQFPAAIIRRRSMFLSREAKKKLEKRLGFPIKGRLHTFYVARKKGRVIGYGIFDTHLVRSKNETLFIVLDSQGMLRHLEVISFFEPTEYMAPQRWLILFRGKRSALFPGVDITAISGATLTTHAVSRSVRSILALYHFYFGSRG